MTQHQAILDYMDKHGTISPMDAFFSLGITKLSTRVSELIRAGHKIDKVPAEIVNRYGVSVRFMTYKKAV